MTTLEIICITYGIGFILNSLLATHYIKSLKLTEPERFVSPIKVMIFVFFSFAAWLYAFVYLLVSFMKRFFKRKSEEEDES